MRQFSVAPGRVVEACAVLMLACVAFVGCSSESEPEASAGAPGAGASNAPSAGMGAASAGTPGSAGAAAGTGGGNAGSSGASTAGTSSGGASTTCASACSANAKCEATTLSCVCNPGFVTQAGACVAAPNGDPTTHTEAEVCAQWKAGHVVSEASALQSAVSECMAGALKPGAITDTLTRINLFRWLENLAPVSDNAQYNSDAQACANLEAWWDFTSTVSAHEPPASSKCYTAAGAMTAGQSNISWGSKGPAGSIDQYMEDNGNETTLGHRRWVLNPPLDFIGIGYWEKGGKYGSASCLRVFSSKGKGNKPSWSAVPPAGFAPLEMAKYEQWSVHGGLAGLAGATAAVVRVDDNQAMPVKLLKLQQGFGEPAMSFAPDGWTAEAGKTYRVTISGLGQGNVTYDVKPVACQ